MKQTALFLPKLQTVRQLSTILEARDEDEKEVSKVSDSVPHREDDSGRRRSFRRIHSCNDILLARGLAEKRAGEKFSLPILPDSAKYQRQSSLSNEITTRNSNSLGVTENTLPDLHPLNRNCSVFDFDTVVCRHSTETNLDAEKHLFHNKENIVASWLQFFG